METGQFELKEYSLEEIAASGLTELFLAFEAAFRAHLQTKVENWDAIEQRLAQKPKEIGPKLLKHMSEKEIPQIRDHSPNHNLYVGLLERACTAANLLRHRYDVGLGIAKKGAWLSFIFNLYGLPTYDCLVVRQGQDRYMAPVDPLLSRSIAGKKILLFDNDAVTGNTIGRVARDLRRANPEAIDVLLAFNPTDIPRELYDQVKGGFKGQPTIYREANGKVLIDATCEVQPHVRKVMTLGQYNADRTKLARIAQKLGVKLPETVR